MKKKCIALCVSLGVATVLYSQTDEDALRYSMLTIGGTARSMGVGGAFGALGADFGSLSINPAGLGFYRGSEFVFTPVISGTSVSSNFTGSINEDQKYNFGIGNFGIVLSGNLSQGKPESKWKQLSFAFGANRLANFSSSTYYNGYNDVNSLTDYYLEEVDGTDPSQVTNTFPFSSALVWETYLINPIANDSSHYNSVIPDGHVQQSRVIDSKGNISEYLFAMGANYDDRLFLGFSLGLPSLHYKYHSNYVESDDNDEITGFQNFVLNDDISTNGIGFNGKFGLIYRINDYVRLGGAIHTPGYFLLNDEYSSSCVSNLETISHEYFSPSGTYNYDLITPWRVTGGISFLSKRYGFISIDYEWLDYREMSFNFKKFVTAEEQAIENDLNQTIDKKYTTASNIRVGGEFIYDIFRVRAGFAWYGSPFADGTEAPGFDYSRVLITGGAGIRFDAFFIDAAYVRTMTDEFFQPYLLQDEDVYGAGLRKKTGEVAITVGLKF